MSTLRLLATCAFGLEAIVARELKALGYDPSIAQSGRVRFSGDESAIARANLWLRSADRVLVELATFEALDFGVLFDQTHELPWARWIPRDGAFPVIGRSHKSQLSSVPACQKIVKKAIAEKLMKQHDVAWCEETGSTFTVEIAMLEDQARLSLDTTGPGLNKRGYRPTVGLAPLKETLAAAMVQLSVWRAGRALIDPFCGTGTIPIEAALLGRRIAPGLRRAFVSESWPTLAESAWREARTEAQDSILPELEPKILGTDIDQRALSLARQHAQQAGVEENIHFQCRPFAELSSKRDYGCVITNPPYGSRMNEREEVEALYREMPLVLRRLTTWSHYVLTSWHDFETILGQKADRRRKLYNGRIECTLYQFFGPRPPRSRPEPEVGSESEIAAEGETASGDETAARLETSSRSEAAEVETASGVESSGLSKQQDATQQGSTRQDPTQQDPTQQDAAKTAKAETALKAQPPSRPEAPAPAFGGLSEKSLHQAEIFRARLSKRVRHLRRWPTRQGITCYRLYDRDVPEVPLVVDRYEDRLHIAEYERPHERTPAEHGDWLDLMKRTAAEVLDLHPRAVFLKRREAPGAASEYELRGSGGSELQVQEGGLTFQVNLSDYLDTGLFLDHRITRDMVRAAARGTRFLNLFAYTGAFSVYAAAGGSRTTTSVDLSNTYLNWTRTNLEANQLAGPTNRLIQSDVLEFLCKHPSGAQYDLAVVDPPTYSNSKRTRQDWDVQRDHVVLLQRLVRLMSPGATIFFSSNFRRFKLGQFNVPGLVIHEISRQTVPADFRNRRIHRCWRIECPTPQSIEREKAARQAAELEAAKRSAAESDPLSARTAQSDSPNPHAAPSETAGQSLTTGPRTESSGY